VVIQQSVQLTLDKSSPIITNLDSASTPETIMVINYTSTRDKTDSVPALNGKPNLHSTGKQDSRKGN